MLADSELGIVTDGRYPPRLRSASNLATAHDHSAPTLIELRGAILDVGIFKDTLLPNLALQSGLSLIAYTVARSNNRLEIKDILWPAAQLLNAYWASIGRRVVYGGLGLGRAFSSLSRPESLLLGGLTLWGTRQLYQVSSRARERRRTLGELQHGDNSRYDAVKREDGFWDRALVTHFLTEAAVQTVITLPFTAPFYHQGGVFTGYHPFGQAFAVGLFSAGFALEALADYQLAQHKASAKDATAVTEDGVWSIVRHPNYLGDILVHLSFPVLLYASDMLAPIELLGPLANYLYLRYGVVENPSFSSSPEKKTSGATSSTGNKLNSFWPAWEQITGNQWLWTVAGAGVAGAVVEQVMHQLSM